MSRKRSKQADGFDDTFEEESFWEAVSHWARRLGHGALEKVLLAYYVGVDPRTPPWARTALLAALGYFALPVDAVPDVLPAVGFSDDVTVLAAALAAVVTCVNDEHLSSASEQLRRWGFAGDDGPDDRGPDDGDVPAAA